MSTKKKKVATHVDNEALLISVIAVFIASIHDIEKKIAGFESRLTEIQKNQSVPSPKKRSWLRMLIPYRV